MVKFLTSYIQNPRNCKYGVKVVKIEDEVNKYKTKTGKTPIVVFDFLACLTMFIADDIEVLCAGRQTECTRRVEELCEKFKQLGCELIFFMDGPLQSNKIQYWLDKVNGKYEDHKLVFEKIAKNTPLKEIQSSHILTSYNNNFARVVKKYGKFIISTSNECDIEIGEYATNNHAVAVFTNDSDFLIMKGDWPIWSSKDFNFKDFTVKAWNKKVLRASLKLDQIHMPMFATLAGNDRLLHKIVEPLYNEIGQNMKGARCFLKLSEYIRREFPKGGFSKEEFDKVVAKCYSYYRNKENSIVESEEQLRRLVSLSLSFYNYKRMSNYEVRPPWLKQHLNETSSTFIYMIMKETPIIIRQNYIDLSNNDVKPFSDLVLPIIRRAMGIVLYDNCKQTIAITRRVYLKPSHEEPFQMQFTSPLYPLFEVPYLRDLLGYGKDKIDEQKKFEILSWIVSSGRRKLDPKNLSEISKSIYFIPAMILNYLVKDRQITCEEADVILLVIKEASTASDEKMKNLSPPETTEKRPFWLAFVYVQIVYFFMSSVIICGLYHYVNYDYFDGFIFHKMYPKYLAMDLDKRKELLEPIEKYRLYVK